MKKLFLVLLTAATAVTAATSLCGCFGNNEASSATESAQNRAAQVQEQTDGGAETNDGGFDFMPPRMPMGMGMPADLGEMPMFPPHGNIFGFTGRHEFLQEMPEFNTDDANTQVKPQGRLHKKKDKKKEQDETHEDSTQNVKDGARDGNMQDTQQDSSNPPRTKENKGGRRHRNNRNRQDGAKQDGNSGN